MSDFSPLLSVLQREDVIPEVVPPNFTPSIFFSIVWPNEKEANSGNFLTREDTLEEPAIHITSASPEASTASYTLVMTDPDAPSRADPKYRQFRHWVITGLRIPPPVGKLSVAVKSQPSTTPYRPPGPPPGSAVHRYSE
ncbi:hypothetical protein C0991_004416 [Blastosporella zonata]|nr:hypothetical protein C0991_004416 [Blastosporella zonata]